MLQYQISEVIIKTKNKSQKVVFNERKDLEEFLMDIAAKNVLSVIDPDSENSVFFDKNEIEEINIKFKLNSRNKNFLSTLCGHNYVKNYSFCKDCGEFDYE